MLNYIDNPGLKKIYPKGFKGTPIDRNNRFQNLDGPMQISFRMFLKWKFSKSPFHEEKMKDSWKAFVHKGSSFLNSDEDCLVWLGHASFFIRIGGVALLIDPVFYSLPLVPRRSELPLDPELLKQIDYLLISHNHRDHCDKKSISLLARNNPSMKILTGLAQEQLISSWTKGHEIQSAGWYQQFDTEKGLEIYYLPSKHWSRRALNDTNRSLWGAFLIRKGGKSIYFSGDTGYGSHFKILPELFGQIDVCIIGCGAYSPAWFMHTNHIAPGDAVKAFRETEAKIMIPMHYGCFDLSDEPYGEPVRLLNQLSTQPGLENAIQIIDIGVPFKL
jgi:L-ascorbate metabolism protein UlaG (beta-lactamase superfamily)